MFCFQCEQTSDAPAVPEIQVSAEKGRYCTVTG